MELDRISLLNAVRCLLEDKPFESDVALPLPSSEFIEATDVMKPLLSALSRGELHGEGIFARVRLDYPEFDDTTTNSELSRLSVDFRQQEQIILGIGIEREPSKIPASSWWFEGAIWEKSILWVSAQQHFDEQRWRGLKIQPTVSFLPERPYEFEELICFHEVSLPLNDVVRWADRMRGETSHKATHNARKAGRKSSEDWESIENHLQNEIENGKVWRDWFEVWDDIVGMMKVVNPNVTDGQPYQKLTNHLDRNNQVLLHHLRTRIRTSRSYEPGGADSTN
ncbi:MAG: hypothetical protein ABJG14_17115 [Sulfitobacter sp.]|uniref:hypothetical protein n=1 Tax=Alphaproteobacteria TaxID=28211 RepID=UPI0032637BE3